MTVYIKIIPLTRMQSGNIVGIMVLQFLLLLLGVCAGASSIIMVKASTLHPVLLASYRQFAAVIFLLPLFFRDLKKKKIPLSPALLKPALLPGMALSLHFITWFFGARMTLSANTTLIVNMAPIVMPFFAFLFLKEVINGPELAGTVLALAGAALLAVFDFHISRETFSGDMLSFISMIFFSVYFTLGRRNRGSSGLWVYLVPVYAVSGLCSFLASLFFVKPWEGLNGHNILMTILLALISTVAGHSILNHAAKVFRIQTVTLVNMSQFIFGGLFGYVFFNEIPKRFFYAASLFITAGTVVVVLFSGLKHNRNRPRRRP
ncbi:MAG: DMT family transporter [Spirochaetales bacterium]|nr:MAG: DMT family transporter [Spirochaetales bacterium]